MFVFMNNTQHLVRTRNLDFQGSVVSTEAFTELHRSFAPKDQESFTFSGVPIYAKRKFPKRIRDTCPTKYEWHEIKHEDF